MADYSQAPLLKAKGEKTRSDKWGKAIRTHELESIIFRAIPGKCGAQLKLILFLTGNANNGSFAVAEKTVIDRCGMTEETYKKARKALVEKGWLIHNVGSKDKAGEIIVDYDAIYKSSEGNTEDTPIQQTENTPENSEYTPKRDIENTYNNISSNINQNDNNSNIITNQKIKEKRQEEKRKNEEKFVF